MQFVTDQVYRSIFLIKTDHNTFLSIVNIFIEGRSTFKYFACFAQIKKFEPFAIQLLGVDFYNGSRIVSNVIPREMICFLIDLFIGRYWFECAFHYIML